uniref:Uncharacterized protein n=1 Tax=Romanomermis culicivorax TaxID=13658 RepID=A0A915L2J1_ROMCU
MYVEPELLAELDDEQKQILFCKMREEQVRRYAEYEKNLEAENVTFPGKNSNDKSRRNIGWLLGADGNPWVWVMGEHAQDKSIEEILDFETQEKAMRLAEEETEMLRAKEEEELKEKLRQEQLEIEQERDLQKMLRTSDDDGNIKNSFNMLKTNNNVQENHISKNSSEADAVILRQKPSEARLRNGDVSNRAVDEHTSKRASEIYQSLIEAREKAQSEALNAAEEEKRYWQMQVKIGLYTRHDLMLRIKSSGTESTSSNTELNPVEPIFRISLEEKKYHEAEEQIRILAKKARGQHKIYTLKTTSALFDKFRSPENNGFSD